jgi:DNA-binding MarR family transcriptional regulator
LSDANDLIEQQLFKLLRRTNSIHLSTAKGEVELERSSYGILCLLLDEGPQRLGAIAQAFQLDPSTVTRQVQAVERLGLAEKAKDPADGRAAVLSLTEPGRETVQRTRELRRKLLGEVLKDWSASDRETFAKLLTRFNTTIDAWVSGDLPVPDYAPAPIRDTDAD